MSRLHWWGATVYFACMIVLLIVGIIELVEGL